MRQRAILTFGEQPLSPFASFARDFSRELNRELEKDMYQNFETHQFMETPEAFLASLDIPGVNFSDINIELEDNKLTISAERKNPFDKTGESVKKYAQTFTLPKNVEEDKINAHYENGVLSLVLPKPADYKSKKKIQVLTGQKPKNWSNFLNFKKNETESALN
jgi:HSP20 family protein